MQTDDTIGPWHIGPWHPPLWNVSDASGRTVADVDTHREARLIAAAPDMLAALEAWTYKNNAGLPYEERLRLTFAAIAKATGGDQ